MDTCETFQAEPSSRPIQIDVVVFKLIVSVDHVFVL